MAKLDFMFNPKNVAVIGASNNPGKIGYAVLKNIIDSGYKGTIIPLNPKEKTILELKCYKSIKDYGPVDLAILCIPEKLVVNIARECGKTGVKGLIVITAGFKEIGSEGLQREKELIQICEEYNMSMLGPNCVGLIDTHAPLNASFATGKPLPGNISFISQSGAMLVSIIDWSFSAGLGFSRFISLGNKANLSEVDFIESSVADPNTKVILCYIEDVVDGKNFIDVVTKASMQKPVIILKSGTSESGAKAASSHTGALAGSDRAYDITFSHSGVIRVKRMEELFELATAFSMMPLPAGDRVGIITNSGGPGIIAADSIEKAGLKMARFDKSTLDILRSDLPKEASIYNPVDILGDAPVSRYELALEKVLADDNTDSVILLLTPTAVTDPEAVADTIIEIRKKYAHKPLFAIFMGGKTLESAKQKIIDNNIPAYTFPEPAVRAIKGMTAYAKFKQEYKEKDKSLKPEGDQNAVKAIFYDVLKDRRLVLLGDETSRVASAYGIPVSPILRAGTKEEAIRISESLGYPVAMKISSHHIIHKTDVGGVKLGLYNKSEVGKAYEDMLRRVKHFLPDAPIYGVEIQKMVDEGIELIIGMTRDIQFGPLIAFGLGGIYVNLLEDVAFSLAAVLKDPDEIENLIRKTKVYSLLRGYRGKKPADIQAVMDTIAKVASLAMDFEEIVEMDINPLRAFHKGVSALDVKITINPNWE